MRSETRVSMKKTINSMNPDQVWHFVHLIQVCVVMQISMRIQMIIDIWVLVSMMDLMPGRGEHETGIFYGKSGVTSWRYGQVNVMSHININTFK